MPTQNNTLPVPTRALVLGDVHHNTPSFELACARALDAGCQIILQVGDFGYFPGTDFGDEFLLAAEKTLAVHGLYCVVIRGNHDNEPALASLERDASGMGIISTHMRYAPTGLHWNWSGVEFLAAGGAVSVDRASRVEGHNYWSSESLSYAEVNACIDAGHADVILAHDCPDGIDVIGAKKPDTDSAAHRRCVSAIVEAVQPSLVFHGHYHVRASTQLNTESHSCQIESLGRDGSLEDHFYILDLAAVATSAP